MEKIIKSSISDLDEINILLKSENLPQIEKSEFSNIFKISNNTNAIKKSKEFSSVCPISSTIMKKKLSDS